MTSKSILAKSLLLFILSIFFVQCSSEPAQQKVSNPSDFEEYITDYPSDVISVKSELKITFRQSVAKEKQTQDILDITPSIDGQGEWVNANTYVFTPNGLLKSNTKYFGKLKLDKLFSLESGEPKTFSFKMATLQQNVSVDFEALKTIDPKKPNALQLIGELSTADIASTEKIKALLEAEHEGTDLNISWKENIHKNTHQFTIKPIVRKKNMSKVKIKVNATDIGALSDKNYDYSVPIKGVFSITGVKAKKSERCVLITFSDPLYPKQNLDGLVLISDVKSPSYVIDNNTIRITYTKSLADEVELRVEPGVLSMGKQKISRGYKKTISYKQIKPEIHSKRNSGIIIPSSQKGVFPIEAQGVNSVEVRISKIFNNNVIQYLQDNDLGGDYRLNHVSRTVHTYRVDLRSQENYDPNRLVLYNLSLDKELTQTDNTLYKVDVFVTRDNANYLCDSPVEDSWANRKNPCSKRYYTHYESPTELSHFFLVSDLGVIVKEGSDKTTHLFVSNLLTTDPVAGASVKLYDFQQQLLTEQTTDAQGKISYTYTERPFVAIVSKDKSKTFIKLDYYNSLTTSEFDGSGQKVSGGLKAFIYGERGVWRPGDDIHLTMILEDAKQSLPANYPITLELRNPQGQLTHTQVYDQGLNGMYYMKTKTDKDALTGVWEARIKVGNQSFSKYLSIETVKPNRLKIELDFGAKEIYYTKKRITGDLQVNWMHGAIGKNLYAEYNLKLVPINTSFKNYGAYTFDNQAIEQETYHEKAYEGRTNEEGTARVNLDLNHIESPRGKLKAILSGTVFETGGDFSVDRTTFIYSPYTSYAGIAPFRLKPGQRYLYTNRDNVLSFVNLDQKGKPLADRRLKVKLIRLSWSWWWDNSFNTVPEYMLDDVSKVKKSTSLVTDSKGRATWKVNLSNSDWGRYYLLVTDEKSNHVAGKTVLFDWADWTSRKSDQTSSEALLYFGTDKSEYNVGETVTVNLPKTSTGRTLVSIENATQVLKHFWIKTEAGQQSFTFKVDQSMTPNVYIHLTQIQKYNSTSNNLPLRLYGLVPITVKNPNSFLKPVIQMPDELRPEQSTTIKISEKLGKPMTYTIALVDEGLLDLTNFKTPKPWYNFYAKEALGVRSWDIYKHVVQAHDAQYLRSLISVGGDGEGLAEASKREENRFEPVVKYLGPFKLKAQESRSHRIDIPAYVGWLRTMVIASDTREKAYGQVQKSVLVNEPLMILGTLPRVTGPGEDISVPVSVFVSSEDIKKVTVSIAARGDLKTDKNTTKTVTFDSPGEKLVMFSIRSKEVRGKGKVTLTAKAGKFKAEQKIPLEVRPSNPMIYEVDKSILNVSDVWESKATANGLAGTNSSSLEVSSFPSINLEQRLNYLIRYPHGCIEQTTSSVFAQLFLGDIMKLTDKQKEEISQNVNAAIERIQKFQTSEGGFSYWPGQSYPSQWGSNYAGHFLVKAKEKGYYVPSSLYDNWLSYQKKEANAWNKSRWSYRDLYQAYRLYTLSLAGESEMGAMNRMTQIADQLDHITRWKLAAAYAVAGYTDEANQIITGLDRTVKDYRELSYTYGSGTRDQALILETLTLLKQDDEAFEILTTIADKLGDSQQWMSTQTTAYALVAIAQFVSGDSDEEGLDFSYTVGDETYDVTTEDRILNIPLGSELNEKVSVQNNQSKKLFVRLTNANIPKVDSEKDFSNRIEMAVRYVDEDRKPVSIQSLEQGTNFTAVVTLTNTSKNVEYKEVALEQIFPSGWEIINERINKDSNDTSTQDFSYQDIRDDRVYTYMDIKAGKSKTFEVKLNATYRGKFYLPSHSVYTMYNNSIRALKAGQWVEVK